MVRTDEIDILKRLIGDKSQAIRIADHEQPFNRKRVSYIVGKYIDRGWLEYGVSTGHVWWADKAAAIKFLEKSEEEMMRALVSAARKGGLEAL